MSSSCAKTARGRRNGDRLMEGKVQISPPVAASLIWTFSRSITATRFPVGVTSATPAVAKPWPRNSPSWANPFDAENGQFARWKLGAEVGMWCRIRGQRRITRQYVRCRRGLRRSLKCPHGKRWRQSEAVAVHSQRLVSSLDFYCRVTRHRCLRRQFGRLWSDIQGSDTPGVLT